MTRITDALRSVDGSLCFGNGRDQVWVKIIFVSLLLGSFVALPMQDVLETTYDESETLPYEGAASPLSGLLGAPSLTSPSYSEQFLSCAVCRAGRVDGLREFGEAEPFGGLQLLIVFGS